MKNLLFIFLFLFVISCSNDSESTVTLPKLQMSQLAKDYLRDALDIMQNNSINRYKIDWTIFRGNTIRYAGNAQTASATYPAIKYAISNLGDHHSSFRPPQSSLLFKTNPQLGNETLTDLLSMYITPIGLRIRDDIGFIRIPAFSGTGDEPLSFAEDLQNLIKSIDDSSVSKWIVDLRQNMGGNMWPMLAGVGPILGNGLAGKFVDPDNNVINWYYENGKSILDQSTIIEIADYYTLINPDPLVAVLTDERTASSGEAIVVAFRGREKTRSFGDLTYGVSTANKGFSLSDNAIIILTVSTMADRNGNLFGGQIRPNEMIAGTFKSDPTDNDNVVNAAINWLNNN